MDIRVGDTLLMKKPHPCGSCPRGPPAAGRC